MNGQQGLLTELPVGYRFRPTDEELVTHYLSNKVHSRPVPSQVVQEIDASELYRKPPNTIVQFSCGEREWFFFIHEDHHCKNKKLRIVGDGIGFWYSIGEEIPIYNLDGNVFAFKILLTYFSGSHLNTKKAKKTHWQMDEYRLPFKIEGDDWVVGRIKRGRDYRSGI